MALQEAILAIEEMSALQVLPLVGIKGFALYLRGSRTGSLDQRMREYLCQFKTGFCEAIAGSEDSSQAALQLGTRRGFQRLLDESDLLSAKKISKEELTGKFAKICHDAKEILSGKEVDRESVEVDIRELRNFLDLASMFSKKHHHETLLRY